MSETVKDIKLQFNKRELRKRVILIKLKSESIVRIEIRANASI